MPFLITFDGHLVAVVMDNNGDFVTIFLPVASVDFRREFHDPVFISGFLFRIPDSGFRIPDFPYAFGQVRHCDRRQQETKLLFKI